MNLIFVRHAEPDYSIDSLTPRGWLEARALAPRVAKWQVKEFYVSPMGRAKDTAREGMALTGRTPVELPWLREFQVPLTRPNGEPGVIYWDLLPEELAAEEGFRDERTWTDCGFMTTGDTRNYYDWVRTEFDRLLERHGYRRTGSCYEPVKPNSDTLVFFCHMGLTLTLVGYLLGISPMLLSTGACCAPSGITVLTSQHRTPEQASFRLWTMGDVSHLTAAGLTPSSAAFFEEQYGDGHRAPWWEPVGDLRETETI